MKREMRNYKFRGKRVDNGAWETGSLVVKRMGLSDESCCIADKMTAYHTPVDPSTVGQYTGLKDKNGEEIYEGDVILATHIAARLEYKCVVEWHGDGFVPMCDDGECAGYGLASSTADMFHIQVIGNIHDNPELLKSDSE